MPCHRRYRVPGAGRGIVGSLATAVRGTTMCCGGAGGLPVVDRIARKLGAESEGERCTFGTELLEALYSGQVSLRGSGQTVYCARDYLAAQATRYDRRRHYATRRTPAGPTRWPRRWICGCANRSAKTPLGRRRALSELRRVKLRTILGGNRRERCAATT